MSDDEDYNSEEDLDYVPSEGEQVSEEENSGDEEDLSVLQDGVQGSGEAKADRRRPAGKKKKETAVARQRKGGIKLDTDEGNPDKQGEEKDGSVDEELLRKKELADQIAQEGEERKQEKDKKRVDDLWSSFLSDVKVPSRSTSSSTTGSGLGSLSSNQAKTTANQNKVTITKVFDFAGEEIKVTKQVDADSKEAKEELRKQDLKEEEAECPKPLGSSAELSRPTTASLKRPAGRGVGGGGGGAAGGGGLGSVLNKIGKKSKMGTLEKSKMDWESFKSKEGLVDDLKIHNKGKQGYTERMAFLNRTDHRQFEMERDLRLGTTSKR